MIYLGCCWFYEFAFLQLVSIVVVFLQFNEQIYFFFCVCVFSLFLFFCPGTAVMMILSGVFHSSDKFYIP